MKLSLLTCVVLAVLSSLLIAIEPVIPVEDIDRDLVTIHATGGAEREDSRLIAQIAVTTRDVSSGEGLMRNTMFRRELTVKLGKVGIDTVRENGVAQLSKEKDKHVTRSLLDVYLNDDSQLVKLKGLIDLWPGVVLEGVRMHLAADTSQQVRASLDAMSSLRAKAAAYEDALGRSLTLVSFQEDPATQTATGRLCVQMRGRFELAE